MNHPVHRSLKAAYSFYNVHTTTPLIDLMGDALILAKSVSTYTSVHLALCVLLLHMKFLFLVAQFFFPSFSPYRKDLMFLMHWT